MIIATGIMMTALRLCAGGGLAVAVAGRGSDGTTATLQITGTLSAAFLDRGSDGTTATKRIN